MKWWQKMIAYELYPKSFNDTTNSGTGDLQGIIDKLDYLKALNIGAIWLTPVCRSPMVDNGYDIADYCDIDPSYGTMNDMKTLMAEAKKRGIRIVIDLVFNHTSEQNPWFLESASSRDNDKSDWYIWRDAREDGTPPTNWRGIFGGSAWTWNDTRQQYYLHTFAKQQPDLNWANPEVRQALYDAANFWIDLGAGGFRIDAITYIKKPDVFKDGTPDAPDGMVGIHDMIANTEGILDYLHEFKRAVRDGHDIFTVGEANGVSAEELPDWVGDNGVFDMLFEFSHINVEFKSVENWMTPDDWTLPDLKRALTQSQKNTKDNGWYPIFFENHDRPRAINHFYKEGANRLLAGKAIGLILYTLRGTPFLYQGEELGMVNVAWDDIADYNDISSIGQYKQAIETGYSHEEAMAAVHRFSRDSARTPMQWDTTVNAGFTTGQPWLPVNDDYQIYNVESELKDPDSMLNWFIKLGQIRQEYDILIKGDYQELWPDDEAIYAYTRQYDDHQATILVNFSGETLDYDPSIITEANCIISNVNNSTKGMLQPYEAVFYLD